MKYIYIVIFLSICFNIDAQVGANELAQAKLDYKNNDFAKALPVFESEYNSKPTDASLNLWYGSCLVEVGGNDKKAEECLLFASKKNLPDSFLYLGDLYTKQYRVAEAQPLYDRFAKLRPREKAKLVERQAVLDDLKRNINRTEDIQIIDSVVVDKSALLSAYNLSTDMGQLVEGSYKTRTPQDLDIVYLNGTEVKKYSGLLVGDKYTIISSEKLIDGEFGNEKKVSEDNFGLTGDINYPYVMSDGMTIYFAGKDENGIGGYDLYVTRYNLNNNTYLTPEKLNMPFNSTANDYLMVVDENKGVGWFATDRFQPEGKVCIYTFIPNDGVKLIESDDEVYMEQRARLSSIKETQIKGKDYTQLKYLAKEKELKEPKRAIDFTFVINDQYTYHYISDFKNESARNLYGQASQKRNDLEQIEKDLSEKRDEYANSTETKRKSLSSSILNLESKKIQLENELFALEIEARNTEIKSF